MSHDPERRLREAQEAEVKLRETIAEARGLLKDVRAVVREAKEERERTVLAAVAFTRETIEETVQAETAGIVPAIRAEADRLMDSLDRIAAERVNLALYGDRRGHESGNKSVFDYVAHLRDALVRVIRLKQLEDGSEVLDDPPLHTMTWSEAEAIFFPTPKGVRIPMPREASPFRSELDEKMVDPESEGNDVG